jgi:phospholipid/cholesterol/gamma-HCH transport system substrate-binding protein
MSTTKNKRAVVLGIFILIGISLLVTIILVMGGQRKSFAKTITVKALFADISGLQTGNNIWLAGVKVGTVKDISFTPDSKVEVSMNILSSMQRYIHKDAKAKIGSESLIGNKIIVLTEGSSQMPAIQSGDVLGVEIALNTDDMMSTLNQNNKNLLSITTDLKDVMQRLAAGQGSIGKLLHDETLANTLQKTFNSLDAASGNARAFTADLSSYTARLQSKGSLTNDLVTDTIIFNRLRSTATQLQHVSETAKEVVNNLEKASASVNSGLNNSSSPAGVLLNDQQAAADLKATLNNLNSGSQKLDEDLEALQHNFLLRGFFKKKEKAKQDSLKTKSKSKSE